MAVVPSFHDHGKLKNTKMWRCRDVAAAIKAEQTIKAGLRYQSSILHQLC